MKNNKLMLRFGRRNLGLYCLTAGFLFFSATSLASSLTLTFPVLKNRTAPIYIAVVKNPANWFDQDANNTVFRRAIFSPTPSSDPFVAVLTEIPDGTYAVKVFQDTLGTGKLETGFFGQPMEPYGFSGNPKSFGMPDFAECSFIVDKSNLALNVNLLNQ